MGETREQRIQEFHEENETPVVGLREGGMLRVQDGHLLLKGIAGARIFTQGNPPAEVSPIADLSALLG
jgi:dipeptidase E